MEHYKLYKLLNHSAVSTVVTKQWIEVNGLSNGQYYVNKYISYQTSMLRSDLCDYSHTYIFEKGTVNARPLHILI